MKKTLTLLLCMAAPSAFAGTLETDYAINVNNFYGYTDYAKPYGKVYKQNNLNSSLNAYGRMTYEFNRSYAASLIGRFMIDSAKEIENYNQGIWGEEAYSLIETPYGDVSLGQDYNVAYNFAVGAPDSGRNGLNNTDLANFITNPNWYKKGGKMSYRTLNSTYINTDGVSPKISYITPSWQGIKLGATFVPETYSQTGLVSKQAAYKDEKAYIAGAYGAWDISGYELEASLGFADYEKNDSEYSAGMSLYRKGWTFGASYRKTEVDSGDYALNKDNLYDSYREGEAYNIGLSYEIGPFSTGISYFDSKAKHTKNRDKIISFSNGWQYNRNVGFSFTVAHQESQGEDRAGKKVRGYAFIAGLELEI